MLAGKEKERKRVNSSSSSSPLFSRRTHVDMGVESELHERSSESLLGEKVVPLIQKKRKKKDEDESKTR